MSVTIPALAFGMPPGRVLAHRRPRTWPASVKEVIGTGPVVAGRGGLIYLMYRLRDFDL